MCIWHFEKIVWPPGENQYDFSSGKYSKGIRWKGRLQLCNIITQTKVAETLSKESGLTVYGGKQDENKIVINCFVAKATQRVFTLFWIDNNTLKDRTLGEK